MEGYLPLSHDKVCVHVCIKMSVQILYKVAEVDIKIGLAICRWECTNYHILYKIQLYFQ